MMPILNIRSYYSNLLVNSFYDTIKSRLIPDSLNTRDGNEYPVNRVFARTSDYLIPKSVFGYSENFSL